MRGMALFLWCWAAISAGCGIDDEDRCPGGTVYNPDVRFCQKADSPEGPGSLALGEACSPSDNQCGPEASVCVAYPGSAAGYCTRTGCTALGCPAGYTCCDCSMFDYPVMCGKNEDMAGILGTYCACT